MKTPLVNRRSTLKPLMLLAGLGATGLTGQAQAQAPAPARSVLGAAQLQAIVERLTGAKVDAFSPGPLPGLHEAIVQGKVLYIDDAGEHLIEGHIIDIANRRSLTLQRQAEYIQASTPTLRIGDLDLKDAITIVRGASTPGRVLIAFEDPRCGFCKRLHATLVGARNLTVHTFTVSFLGPESRQLNEQIWCAPDRAKAWQAAMGGDALTKTDVACDLGALDRNMALAERYRVQGTPTLFTAAGLRLNGAVSLEAIEQALSAGG